MKSNSTLNLLKTCVLTCFVILSATSIVVAQTAPKFSFKNAVLESGVANSENALYRFPDVIPHVDALVSVDAIVGNIQLRNIDRTADGYAEAFQPEYKIGALAAVGYIDFTIKFVHANSSSSYSQTIVTASGLDIDGSGGGLNLLKEYNMLDMGGGIASYDVDNSELTVSKTGTAFLAQNITGILHGELVDTAAGGIMFTVSNANVTAFKYRVGANTLLSTSSTRYASLYFMDFAYGGTVLPVSNLKAFNGVSNNGSVKLQWSLNTGNNAQGIVLEKSVKGKDFKSQSEFFTNIHDGKTSNFSYEDLKSSSDAAYYRLKITSAEGRVEYSNVLYFRAEQGTSNASFAVFPTQINGSLTAQVRANSSQKASFEVMDYTGRVVYRQSIGLQSGENNIRISDLEKLPAGHYISAIRTTEKTFSQKIYKL